MLQRNQIYCMDALDLLRALDPQSVDMVLCDLPYGILESENLTWDTVIDLGAMWTEIKRVIKPKHAVVLTARQPFTTDLINSNRAWFRYEMIWCKPQGTDFLNANRKPLSAHENILVFASGMPRYFPQLEQGKPYATTSGSVGGFVRDKTVSNFLTANEGTRHPKTWVLYDAEQGLHPTQKPSKLFEHLIKSHTQEGELVVDMTCGSGTTAIAARKCGRDFICGDNSAEYVNMARHRLATSDPYQDKPLKDGRKQLSLFSAEFDKRGEP